MSKHLAVETSGPCCEHWLRPSKEGKSNIFYSCAVDVINNGEDFYCVECLWELTSRYPILTIDKTNIRESEDTICWEEGRWTKLKHDANNPHYLRVLNADLNYPLLVTPVTLHPEATEEMYTILDGCHRYIASEREVRCRVVGWDLLSSIRFRWP